MTHSLASFVALFPQFILSGKVVNKKQRSKLVDDAKNDLSITTHTAKSSINVEVVVHRTRGTDYYF